ncbi:hypothetical protein CPAR01_15363 [Colletotrichum paranaense]|uniref:Secreted protein n=1 Tax=Colletotrichum paranaense TaxID=1914294 RepID=A0ABQ9RYX8_9PEZI|nr:uncharacterized protein CPAR01_15363 [Colletotrichum paranaense]KAK1519870.1 hypothetical protein CPAR01_15363 [Colletotrichum paranaense]
MYRYVPRVVARWLLWVRGTCLVLESPVTIPCSISGWVFTVRFAAPVYYSVYLQFFLLSVACTKPGYKVAISRGGHCWVGGRSCSS